ncbi:MAG TPA: hypothetical protein VEQ58_17045, partial [Polyangiaceae bacterium]|nr:hypothetical protein [Polyangiaceae bacterium]
MEIRVGGLLMLLAALLSSARASAGVVQTDGTAIPVLPSAAERTFIAQSWAWNPTTQINTDSSGNPFDPPIVLGEYYSPPAFPQFVDDDAITLSGLFKWRREAIDWKADATAPAGSFVPHCAMTVEPLLQGGTCNLRLAWYNVAEPASSKAPNPSELYPVLPNDLATFLDCQAPLSSGFCPLAWNNTDPRNLSIELWTPNRVTLDFAHDAR